MKQETGKQGEKLSLANGSVHLNFGFMYLRKIRIVKPPVAVLACNKKSAGSLMRRALRNRKEFKILATLRAMRLPKLNPGEIRVMDADNTTDWFMQSPLMIRIMR